MHSNGTPGYTAPDSVFMGYSKVKPTLEEKYAGQVPDMPQQLYPKSGAIPNWAEWSSANCCLSVLITAGCPLGIQPPLSAGWCCQGRQLRGILASQASLWRGGKSKMLREGSPQTPGSKTGGVIGEQGGSGAQEESLH